jgi:hypothetical protein
LAQWFWRSWKCKVHKRPEKLTWAFSSGELKTRSCITTSVAQSRSLSPQIPEHRSKSCSPKPMQVKILHPDTKQESFTCHPFIVSSRVIPWAGNLIGLVCPHYFRGKHRG